MSIDGIVFSDSISIFLLWIVQMSSNGPKAKAEDNVAHVYSWNSCRPGHLPSVVGQLTLLGNHLTLNQQQLHVPRQPLLFGWVSYPDLIKFKQRGAGLLEKLFHRFLHTVQGVVHLNTRSFLAMHKNASSGKGPLKPLNSTTQKDKCYRKVDSLKDVSSYSTTQVHAQ